MAMERLYIYPQNERSIKGFASQDKTVVTLYYQKSYQANILVALVDIIR